MSNVILQWGLVSFLIGILLSLPLAAVHYNHAPSWTCVFANPRKLKSAHLDFFMQAFASGFAFMLETALHTAWPLYIVIPLLYGTIGNPLILLLEATAIYRKGAMFLLYRLLKATSPASLLFSWFMIGFAFLPLGPIVFIGLFAIAIVLVIWTYRAGDTEGRT
jgi:hypothetical protein